MKNPGSILVVVTRRLGDVLLATALVRSLRRAYPDAMIDVLAFAGKAGVLEGNPDCDHVIEVPERPRRGEHLAFMRRIFRRYDLGIAAQHSDRSHLYAFLAARKRIGVVPDKRASSLWKRLSCSSYVFLDNRDTHTVVQNLRLADVLGIPRVYEVVPPGGTGAPARKPLAVLHPVPMFEYKRWTQAGWRTLVGWLRARGLEVVLTGGPGEEERRYCAALAKETGATSRAGELSFVALAQLIGRARLFVGPDTSITHLAAACGTPTLALFGPTNPVKWGPWPAGCETDPSPWRRLARPWQRQGNVIILQGVQPPDLGHCVPCLQEGCERHVGSASRCLVEMPADPVLAAAQALLSMTEDTVS